MVPNLFEAYNCLIETKFECMKKASNRIGSILKHWVFLGKDNRSKLSVHEKGNNVRTEQWSTFSIFT